MLRMTPGQCAEGVLGGATALGSFDLTVRGVRETPSVRSELWKYLIVLGWCGWLVGVAGSSASAP